MSARPPQFHQASNLRQRVRAAGMNPEYWYPLEFSDRLAPSQVLATRFNGRGIALFRDQQGQPHAIEDRCAHRQLPLSMGDVDGCHLVCAYHGWAYNGDGVVESIPHDLFGRAMPKFRVPSFPVEERHGLIWIFPGTPAEAANHSIPSMPEKDGPQALPYLTVDFLWRAHHSIILDNLNDLTHSFLHRDYAPFNEPKLTVHDCQGDRAYLLYKTAMVEGKISRSLFDRNTSRTDEIEIEYQYPYQWGYSGGRVRHRIFLTALDECTTRVFFFFFFEPIRIPLTPWTVPQRLMKLLMPIIRRFYVRPLLSQDGYAVEREQEAYERHFDQPLAELNPAVPLFQEILVQKWQEHLDTSLRKTGAGAGV